MPKNLCSYDTNRILLQIAKKSILKACSHDINPRSTLGLLFQLTFEYLCLYDILEKPFLLGAAEISAVSRIFGKISAFSPRKRMKLLFLLTVCIWKTWPLEFAVRIC